MLPLLPIIPIPTGKKFETVVAGEGSILEGNFYAEFFNAVARGLANASAFSPTTLAAEADESAVSERASGGTRNPRCGCQQAALTAHQVKTK